jgi:hypothetical protein
MRFPSTSYFTTLAVITIVLGVLLASLLLLFGIANLINPDVPDSYLDQNTRVCVMFILTGLVSIYALCRPFSGGILLCLCVAPLGFIIVNPVAVPVLLFGVLSIMRSRRSRQTASEDPDQPS